MRTKLKRLEGARLRFRGIVERFGTKRNWHGFPEPTLLLRDVHFVDNGESATEHLWFTVGKIIESLGLEVGDVVEFDARIGSYVKGYVNHREGIDDRRIDYKLNRPTKWAKVGKGEIEAQENTP